MSYLDVQRHYLDYEEPEEPKQIRNCPKCGRFLTKEPNGELIHVEPNGHWEKSPMGGTLPDGDCSTEDELVWVEDGLPVVSGVEPAWACKCGAQWGSDDIFKS